MNQQSDKVPTATQSTKRQTTKRQTTKRQTTKRRSRQDAIIKKDIKAIDELCRKGSPERLAEQYICYCLDQTPARLPNMAGFFRWMELSAAARDHFKKNHPDRFQTVKMIFEDEALNSPLPPSIVSSYMKQYFSADRDAAESLPSEDAPAGITLLFEHDIQSDGE